MKYLKPYKLFFENLETNDSDDEIVKASKECLNKLKDQLSEYKSKKSTLEGLFKNLESIQEINDKLSDIIGEEDKRNCFLSELATIEKIKWQIQKKHDDNANDKVKSDDLSSDSQTVTDSTALKVKISEINDRISVRSSEISDLEKELKEKESEWIDKIKEKEKYLQDNIKKVTE